MLIVRKRLELRYDRPVRHASRLLRVRPLEGHAAWRGHKYLRQELLGFEWRCDPSPSSWREVLDEYGAKVLEIVVEPAHQRWLFEAQGKVQVLVACSQVLEEGIGRWLLPSRLCPRLAQVLALSNKANGSGMALAHELNQLAFGSLRYVDGATDEATTAGEALELGAGVCQDFAHLLIALCRARRLPARYVSGYGRAPGRMHAWAEVWIDGGWHAFDPTHGRAGDEKSVTVAVGRDLRDVRPLEGVFQACGRARAQLDTLCCVDDAVEQSTGEERGAGGYNNGQR